MKKLQMILVIAGVFILVAACGKSGAGNKKEERMGENTRMPENIGIVKNTRMPEEERMREKIKYRKKKHKKWN